LSVLLSVHDDQANLAGLMADLLEVLPELTGRFEVLVIDNGSRDATGEAAHDLARRFPQIRVLRNAARQGRAAVLRRGLAASQHSLILFRDEGCRLDTHDLHKLWRAFGRHDAALGRDADTQYASSSPNWLARLNVWRLRLPSTASGQGEMYGWQLYRRDALAKVLHAASDQRELAAELARRGLSWTEVGMREARTMEGRFLHGRSVRLDPANRPRPMAAESPRARRLAKIRDFALGE
jgi:glycosyltransferase involved in cell wall biosynthesis